MSDLSLDWDGAEAKIRDKSESEAPRRDSRAVPAADRDGRPLKDRSLHPAAIAAGIGSFVYVLIVSWLAFGSGTTTADLGVVTLLGVMFFALMAGGGAFAYQAGRQPKHRSFRKFLKGEVDLATGPVSGLEALVEAAVMPLTLAIGGTVIILIAMANHL